VAIGSSALQWLVHQQHFGEAAIARAMQSRLLLATG